jgi:FHA domain
MPEFIVRSGKYAGKKFVLPGVEVLIGRDEGCQIRITSQDVSRQHCLIRMTESGWTVKDLGSQNGTFLNEAPTTSESELRPGDRVRVGPMVLELTDPAVKPMPPPTGRAPGTTDDDIADWLSDDEIPVATGDTTIVKAAAVPPPPPDDDTATSDVPAGARERERKFQTIADEAADIIRRHRDMLLQEERDAAG